MKKGYTLVEVIVALCLSAVFFAALAAIVMPTYASFGKVSSSSNARLLADNVADRIHTVCTAAKEISADSESQLTVDGQALCADADGRLMLGAEQLLSEAIYDEMSVSVTFSQANDTAIVAQVYVFKDGNQLAEALTAVSTVAGLLGEVDELPGEIPGGDDNPSPEGIISVTKDFIENGDYDHKGSPQHRIFRYIYEKIYKCKFPMYDVSKVISDERLQAVYDASLEKYGDEWNPVSKRFESLLNEEMTMAVYIPPGTYTPLVYLTNTPSMFDTQDHAPVYMMYYEGIWYVPSSTKSSQEYMNLFNGKNERQIKAILGDERRWITASDLSVDKY